jgi:hypothetical protein
VATHARARAVVMETEKPVWSLVFVVVVLLDRKKPVTRAAKIHSLSGRHKWGRDIGDVCSARCHFSHKGGKSRDSVSFAKPHVTLLFAIKWDSFVQTIAYIQADFKCCVASFCCISPQD